MGYNPNGKSLTARDMKNSVQKITGIERDFDKKLKMNLLVPSTANTYSTCIETISKWFCGKFSSKFFKNTYIEYSHVFDQFRTSNKRDRVKIDNPSLAITPTLDFSFNRENLDLYEYGNKVYNNRCSYRDAFFNDDDRNLKVTLKPEMLLMNFNFKLRFSTKAQQIDIAKKCELAFKSRASEKLYMDVDFPVPIELMRQIAQDSGYNIDTGKMTDILDFIGYLNSNSVIPFMFKFDTGSGSFKFFIKLSRGLVHIRVGELTIDDGNRYGDIYSSFMLTFDCQVRYPSPKFYAYFSYVNRESLKSETVLDDESFYVSAFNIATIPSKNDKGWSWNIRTEYSFISNAENKEKLKNGEPLSIEFAELINNDIGYVVDYVKKMKLSPELCMDFKVFNSDGEIKSYTDWDKLVIHLIGPNKYEKVTVVAYMDMNFINTKIIEIKEYGTHRVQPTNTMINTITYNKE